MMEYPIFMQFTEKFIFYDQECILFLEQILLLNVCMVKIKISIVTFRGGKIGRTHGVTRLG
jgi:hypothetical protein